MNILTKHLLRTIAQNSAAQPLTECYGLVSVCLGVECLPRDKQKRNHSTCEGLFGKILRNGRCCRREGPCPDARSFASALYNICIHLMLLLVKIQ